MDKGTKPKGVGPRYDLFLLSGIRMAKLLKILKAAGGLTSFPPVEKRGRSHIGPSFLRGPVESICRGALRPGT